MPVTQGGFSASEKAEPVAVCSQQCVIVVLSGLGNTMKGRTHKMVVVLPLLLVSVTEHHIVGENESCGS